ncbi:hypothetical protein GO308_12795 [Sphingomonas sp. SFZ2018-12]|uniref:hypothetical protein n=1 Tax=Sphingomonas sp. SFZ2018-12 TaxID=2683197 RepID=UPI001F0D2749|nr:hypothetical protein [Sphingomonas sp. SFZ2018-12]MCH4893993.1 hypothetical protein [Sphingomonas sp. SFZ2018-12]
MNRIRTLWRLMSRVKGFGRGMVMIEKSRKTGAAATSEMALRARRLRKQEENARASAPLINPFAAAHGDYERVPIVDTSGEHGEGRNRVFWAMVNRGGTPIARWIAAEERQAATEIDMQVPAKDRRRRLFGEIEQRAVRYCIGLWEAAEGRGATDPTRERIIGSGDGWAQQEALDELAYLKREIPAGYWDVWENVVRFDQEAGTAGSSLANNKRSAIDAAKVCCAFVASLIAQKAGL